MNLIKRYWAAGLILMVVAAHAVIIGYVRTRIAKLNRTRSAAIEVGMFRFQPISDLATVYQFRLHVVPEHAHRHEVEESIGQNQIEITESAETRLRHADAESLADPNLKTIRQQLQEVVTSQLREPSIQKVMITDWLVVPSSLMSHHLAEKP